MSFTTTATTQPIHQPIHRPTRSSMDFCNELFAKAIGRHDRKELKNRKAAKPNIRRSVHNGNPEDAPGFVTTMTFSVKMLVYPEGTRDIDCANATPVSEKDLARFFERGHAVAYAVWLATAAGKGNKPHAFDVYEGERKVYRAG